MEKLDFGKFMDNYEKAGYDTEWATCFVHWLSVEEIIHIIDKSKWRHIEYKELEWTFDGWDIVYIGKKDPNFDIENFF